MGDIIYKPLTKVTEHEYLLPLDGQTIDGVTYKRLTDYLGTNVLPNLNGRYLRADSTPGTMVEAGLPNITGKLSVVGSNAETGWLVNTHGSGCFKNFIAKKGLQAFASCETNTSDSTNNQEFSAKYSNAIYGKSTTVTPLTYTVRAYIAYA